MKTIFLAGISASFLGLFAACSTSNDVAETHDPPVTVPTPAEEDAGAEPDAAKPPASCATPAPDPTCADTTAPPASAAAVSKFIVDESFPIRCADEGGDAVWDVRPLLERFGDGRLFALGEVHGTNEIGITSSVLLRALATEKLVNVVAFELPMDYEAALQRWVDTGDDATAEQLFEYLAPNMFGVILPKTARELAQKGIALRVGAVDIPTAPDVAVLAIEDVATKLTTQKETVLATLPKTPSMPPSNDDVAKANAYFDLITGKKAEICAELTEADCDRLVAMTHALWASTLSYDRGGDDQLWFARREEVIYYNLRSKIAGPNDRMYLHMGAFHTNKHVASAGSRMAQEYAPTKGKMLSIAPAYGDGSVIWYGEDLDLPGEPRTILSALTDAPEQPMFVSSTRPTDACEENPLGAEPEESIGGGTRAELYDGYIHYGKLTSERRPTQTTLSAGEGVVAGAALVAFRARIEQRERAALSRLRVRR